MTSRGQDFRTIEAAFTAHVRDPAMTPPPPDVSPARMAVYATLVYRNLDSLLAGSFPVLHQVLPSATWAALVRAFLVDHRAQTPLFSRVPHEFVRFLANAPCAAEPGYMRELAHYEWLELEVGYDTRAFDPTLIDTGADLVRDVPVLNPFARLQVYAYPVHRVGPAYLPTAAPATPTCLVVFRERDDGVAFIELTPVTARLVELIQHNAGEASGETLLRRLAEELAHPDPPTLVAQGRAILQDLHARQLLAGARFTGRSSV